jgi:acyl carrier protein
MEQTIIEIVKNILPDKSKSVLPTSDLIESLGFDSVNILELITALEEKFGILFEDEDLDLANFGTINAIQVTLGKYGKS